jgi:hypothetical protein
MGWRGGAEKLVEWRRRLARFETWQQTVAEFCAAEQISVPTFYVWKKRLESLGNLGEFSDPLSCSETQVHAEPPASSLTSLGLADASLDAADGISGPYNISPVMENSSTTATSGLTSTTSGLAAAPSNAISRLSDSGTPQPKRRHHVTRRKKPTSSPRSNNDRPTQSSFLPVRISGAWSMQLELPNGVRVSVPSNDTSAIQAVIAAAGQLSFSYLAGRSS